MLGRIVLDMSDELSETAPMPKQLTPAESAMTSNSNPTAWLAEMRSMETEGEITPAQQPAEEQL
jgi:hypothetical protein